MFNKFEIIEANSKIDGFISNLVEDTRVRGFYPGTISKELDIPLTLVLNKMNKISEDGIIEIKYEIRCDDSHLEKTVDDYTEYLNKYIYCRKCGKEIYITRNNILLKYFINKEFREYKKKSNSAVISKNIKRKGSIIKKEDMNLSEIEETINIENNINITNIINKTNIDKIENEIDKTEIDKGLLERLIDIKDFWELLEWLGEVYKNAKPVAFIVIRKIIIPAISSMGGIEYLDLLLQLYPSRDLILNTIRIEYQKIKPLNKN